MEKHTWSRNENVMDASLWEGNLLQYAWYTSTILKHVKFLGLAEQNHGYLTSLHRIGSDKISDKERRVRKFPPFETATMLWRHMVIKFDNDPGLLTHPARWRKLNFGNDDYRLLFVKRRNPIKKPATNNKRIRWYQLYFILWIQCEKSRRIGGSIQKSQMFIFYIFFAY